MKPVCDNFKFTGRAEGGTCLIPAVAKRGEQPSYGGCDPCRFNKAKGQMRAAFKAGGPTQVTIEAQQPLTPEQMAARCADRDKITRALWEELHGRWKVADLSTAGASEGEKAWLAAFLTRVPCGDCKQHWSQWTAANPPDLNSAPAYFAWGWRGHNAVNVIRGVAPMDLLTAAALYGLAEGQLNGLRPAVNGPSTP